MADDMRVLVVGAGVAGLTLGRALHAQGALVEIVERTTEPAFGGMGIYLPGNGYRALKALGLHEAILAESVVITHQHLQNHRGRTLRQIDLRKLWGRDAPCLALLRSSLYRTLLAGASGVPIRFGTTIHSLNLDDEAARVVLSDGSARDFDLVVGADGAHSTVRRLVFDDRPPAHVGQVSWRFVVDDVPEITSWTAMLAKGRTFLMIPIGGGRLYCYADIGSRRTHDPSGGDVQLFKALFQDFAEPVPRILARIESGQPCHFSPIEEVTLQDWVRGRAVLIGDAAHAMSPNMAEGASLAFEDSWLLSEILGARRPLSASLSEFVARRAPRIRKVLEQTHRRDNTRSLAPPLRDIALSVFGEQIFRANYRPLLDDP